MEVAIGTDEADVWEITDNFDYAWEPHVGAAASRCTYDFFTTF